MSSRFDRAYRVDNRTVFNAIFWNRVLRDLDTRILSVEEKKVAFEEAEKILLDLGLKRINETLLPVAEHIMRVSELGFLAASSDTAAALSTGDVVTLVVREGEQRGLFRPSPFIALTRRSTMADYALARTVSYDAETGVLIFQVEVVVGNGGPHNDWDIAALAGSVAAMTSALDETRSLRQGIAEDRVAITQVGQTVAEDRQAVAQARTDAATFRTQAGQSSDAAASHLATFLQVYRGALASAPANGVVGHFYFDTTQQQARVFTTTGWAPLFTVALGGIRQGEHTATAGQTVFNVEGGFTYLNVFKNGLLLVPGTDYTASDPQFTLTGGASAGDVLAYIAYRASDETDFYTKAVSDGRYVLVDEMDGAVNPYKHKRSTTAGHIPAAGDLVLGELFLNTTDGRIFARTPSGVRTFRNAADNDASFLKKVGDTILGVLGFRSGEASSTRRVMEFGWEDQQRVIGLDLHESGGLEFHAYNPTNGNWLRRILRLGHDGFLELDRDPTAASHVVRKAYADSKVAKAGDSDLGFFRSGLHNLGKSNALTIKPALTTSNFKFIENNGAFTLQAPDAGNYTMVIVVRNVAGSGDMNHTGFAQVTGTFRPEAGRVQRLFITVVGNDRFLDIVGR